MSLVRSSGSWCEGEDLTGLWDSPKSHLGGRADGRCTNNIAQPGNERQGLSLQAWMWAKGWKSQMMMVRASKIHWYNHSPDHGVFHEFLGSGFSSVSSNS